MNVRLARTAATTVLVVLLVASVTTAPVAAAPATHDAQMSAAQTDDPPVPVCYDVTGTVNDQVPYDQIIWVDDLPEDVQPPGVPWSLVTPEFVGALATGIVPNQCEVADPTNPPYDPREDNLAPDGGGDVVEGEDGTTLIIVNGTLDRTADGPGAEATLGLVPDTNGELDPGLVVNDGEKDYALDPRIEYWEDGTIYLESDVVVIGRNAGIEFDCNGPECQPDARGAPSLVDYPTVPSHTDEDHTSGESTTPDAEEPAVDETPTPEPTETPTPEPTETDTPTPEPEQTTAASSAGGSPDSSSGGNGDAADQSGGGQQADAESGGSEGGGQAGDSSGDGGESADRSATATATTTGTPTLSDGPGFGPGVAVLALGGLALLARRGL